MVASTRHSWVTPNQLIGDWLSAQAHQAQYLEARTLIASAAPTSAPLGTLCVRITQGPNPEYDGAEYPCVITRNISDGHLRMEGSNWVSKAEFARLERFRLQHGDVLVTLKGAGSTGKACLFFAELVAIHSREVGVVRARPGSVDTRYLAAYFQSKFGRLLFDQGTTGSTGQLTLSTTYLKGLPVPLPDQRVQEHIGAKVELAERCRTKGHVLRAEALSRFDALTRAASFHPSKAAHTRISASELTSRLTSEFYLPRYFDLEAHLGSLGVRILPIRQLLRQDIIRSSTPERTDAGPVPCILTSDIDPYEISWRRPTLRISPEVGDGHGGRLAPRDVVYTSVGPPVGEAAVVLQEYLPMCVGGDVSILRHGEGLHPGYLALYLNSAFGQMQNDRYSRGIRQRRVYPEDIGAFLIPELSHHDQSFIGDRIVAHQALNEQAIELLAEARTDVENMIAGMLDTAAIISGRTKPRCAQDVPGLEDGRA